MKTKRFRILSVLLIVVMFWALSLNIFAATGNAVTRDGLTAQLFTDKDFYNTGDSVKASVQEVFIFAEINVPEVLKLASKSAAFDALLKDGESWITPGGVLLSANRADIVGSSTATGDNMQAGFWVIITFLAVGSFAALFIYGKNKTTWLSIMLCIAMVGGMMAMAVPVQAGNTSEDIQLSCTIQVDGKAIDVSATVSYVIYDDMDEDEEELSETPEASVTPVPEASTTPSPEPEASTTPSPEPEASATPSLEPEASLTPSPETEASPTPTPESPLVLHVSVGGAIVDGCSEETHYADIAAAQTALRSLDHSNRSVEVLIHAGTYKLVDSVEFTSEDSGTEAYPIVYKAAGDGEVVFTGATTLDATKFSTITDEAILNRLPEEARTQVVAMSLEGYGIDSKVLDYKERYINARDPLAIVNLYVNDKSQTLSRYPNAGYEGISEVKESGDAWTLRENAKTYGAFVYEGNNPDRWINADQAYVVGYLQYEYLRDRVSIGSVDPTNNIITLADFTTYGISTSGRWYVTNLLEEIDTPGEYFVDANNMILYYYPTESLDANDKVELTALNDTLITLTGAEYIEFNGIHFKGTLADGIVIEPIHNAGEDKIKPENITKHSSNIIVRNCEFNDIGSDAIEIFGRNNLIEGCTLYDIGLEGVNILGGADPRTYTESKNIIANNHFWNVGTQNSNLYKYAISLGRNTDSQVIGDVVEYNIIHGEPGACAIIYGGLGNVIRYNEIFALSSEAADMGLIYSGKRLNEFGNVIEYNYIHDYGVNFTAGYKLQAIYWDDWQSGQTAKHNIIVPNNKGNTSANLAVGAYNTFTENIVVNSANGLHMTDRNRIADATAYNTLSNAATTTSAVLEKYPQITALKELLGDNSAIFPVANNVLTNNLTVSVNTNSISETVKEKGTVSRNVNIADLNVFVNPAKHDYRLTNEAMETYELPETMINESNFNMNSIGIQSNVFAVQTPASEFKLLYPANGQTVSAAKLCLKWEEARFADEYDYVVATDEAMTNVVASGTAYRPCVIIDSLENSTTYFYKVTAKCLSKQIGNTWECAGGAYTFTTSTPDALDVTALNEKIAELEALQVNVSNNIGTEVGQFKVSGYNAIVDMLTEAKVLENTAGCTQDDVDEMVVELTSFIKGINGYRNSGVAVLNVNGEWKSSKDTDLTVTSSTDPETNVKTVRLEQFAHGWGYLNQKLNNYETYKFKMKLDANVYASIGIRQTNIGLRPHKANTAYVLLVYPNKFELYRRLDGVQVGLTSCTTETNNMGEWHEIEFGAVDVIGGVEITLKVDGEEVISYTDTTDPIYQEGYFAIYPGYPNSSNVELQQANTVEEAPTSSVVDLNLDGEWLGSTGTHNVTVTTTTDPETNVKTLKFAQTNGQHGWGYLNEKLDNNNAYKFKMKLDIESTYASIGIRQDGTGLRPHKANNAYVLVIYPDKFELFRRLNGAQVGLTSCTNDTINMDEWHEIELGAVDVIGGVQITLKVDGTEVLNYTDTTNPISQAGYFTIYPGPGNSSAEFQKAGTVEQTPNSNVVDLDLTGEWLGSTGSHNVTVTTTTDPETNATTLKFAQTNGQHGWGYLNEKLDNNNAYKFKLKLDIVSTYASIGIRQDGTGLRPHKANNAYVLVINKAQSQFELWKYLNKAGEAVGTSAFGDIDISQWHEIELGAVDVIGGVQVTLKVDGKEVFNYTDTTNPISQAGYFTIYPGPGNSSAEIQKAD